MPITRAVDVFFFSLSHVGLHGAQLFWVGLRLKQLFFGDAERGP